MIFPQAGRYAEWGRKFFVIKPLFPAARLVANDFLLYPCPYY